MGRKRTKRMISRWHRGRLAASSHSNILLILSERISLAISMKVVRVTQSANSMNTTIQWAYSRPQKFFPIFGSHLVVTRICKYRFVIQRSPAQEAIHCPASAKKLLSRHTSLRSVRGVNLNSQILQLHTFSVSHSLEFTSLGSRFH